MITVKTLNIFLFIIVTYVLGVLICKEYALYKVNQARREGITIDYQLRYPEVASEGQDFQDRIAENLAAD